MQHLLVMFGIGRRLSELEARIQDLRDLVGALDKRLAHAEELIDLPELERMRASVLNALRSYRRSLTSQDAPGPTNGGRPDSHRQLEPITPPGPRRNY
jgi:hypothetical protein